MEQSLMGNNQSAYGRFKTWSIVLGVAMIILGLVTISFSGVSTWFTVFFLGIILVVRGVIDVSMALLSVREKGFWWRLFGGILSVVIGSLMIAKPEISAAVITFIIAIFLISSGLFRSVAAPVEHGSQWGWVMMGGVVSLIFGIWIMAAFPQISFVFIGLLVGIEILVQGMVMISLPYTLRQTKKPSGEAFAR